MSVLQFLTLTSQLYMLPAVLVSLSLQLQASTLVESRNFAECSYKGKIPDKRSCRHYHECNGEGVSRRKTCPRKMYFESKVAKCIKPSSTPCVNNPRAPDLKGISCFKNNEKRPSLIDCGSYFVCRDNKFAQINCPPSTIFSRVGLECVGEDDICKNTKSYQASLVSNEDNPYFGKCDKERSTMSMTKMNGSILQTQTLPDPYECSMYIKCEIDLRQEMHSVYMVIAECESGFLYDGEVGLCKQALRVKCGQRFRDSMLYGPEKRSDNSSLARGDVDVVSGAATGSRLQAGAIPIDHNGQQLNTTMDNAFKKWSKSVPGQPRSTIPRNEFLENAEQGIQSNIRNILVKELEPHDKILPAQEKTPLDSVSTHPGRHNAKPLLNPDSFPEFNVENYAQNYLGTRKKRRLKTTVKKTVAEFFDDDGNLTSVANGTKNPGSPKMKVTYVETETVYDGSNESREKKARQGKTAEEAALQVQDKLPRDQSLGKNDAGKNGNYGRRNRNGSRMTNMSDKLNIRSEINSQERSYWKKQSTLGTQQKLSHYQEYEAAPDNEYELKVERNY